MKLEIPPTKLFIAIFACTFSIVSTTDYSIFDDADIITTNATALPKSEFRRYIDVPETLHVSRRSARHHISNARLKQRRRHHIVINVTRDQSDSFDFEHPQEYDQIVEKFYLVNLHTADRLAENAVSIFGYVLESPNSGLTIEQYSSLEIIHNAIKRRQFHMYRLLKVLDQLQQQPCIRQFYLIMLALSVKLPPYLACAAKFWVSQMDFQTFNLSTLAILIEDSNFLTGINENEIAFGNLYVKEMELNGYDDASKVTEAIVGPYFVHIFALMSKNTLIVSQPLFASILLNLPNRDGDPIFNEYVRFIAKIAWEGKIPNWGTKNHTPKIRDDIHFLINKMVFMICRDPDVTYDIKQALWYIRNHLESSAKHTVVQSTAEAYWASRDGIHIHQLLALITPHEFSPHANRLKVQLFKHIASNQPVIQKTLAGMNLYGYTSSKHLLFAFLTRLRTRLPLEEIEIRESVTALLSILMLKREAWSFYGLQDGGITLWTLLDTINDFETDPKMAELVQPIMNELLGKVGFWSAIRNMNLNHMNKCDSAEVCLHKMLQILVKRLPPDSVSSETFVMIKKLMDMIADKIYRLTIPVKSNKPSLCECPTTVSPAIPRTSEPPSEEPPVHHYTTTVSTSIPGISEPPSEEPPVHYYTSTVSPAIPGISEPPSEEPPVHYYASTVSPAIPGISEPPSEEPPVHYYTSTVSPAIPGISEPPSEEPPVHYYASTVSPAIPGISEPPSEEPPVHYYTSTVSPAIPGISEPPSEEPPVHYYASTVSPAIPGISEPPSEEPPVHYYTSTVSPAIPGISEPPSEEPPVHYYASTVSPAIPGISEPPSEEPPIHYYTSTVSPAIPGISEPPSEEPPVHHYTTTVSTSIPGISEPPSEEPPVHYYASTVSPAIPGISEPPSEEPPVHYYTSTVSPAIPGISEPPSEEPPVHYYTSTVSPAIPGISEPPSEEPPVHYYTSTVSPAIPGISEPPSEEPPVHYYTSTVSPAIPGISEPPSEEPPVHNYTTWAWPSIPAVLPPFIYPEMGIHVRVPESGLRPIEIARIDENYNPSEIVIVPSIACLQENPSADKFKGECEEDLNSITSILRRAFGEDYISVLLGDEWRVHYPTRISLLDALIEKAEKSDELSKQTNDLWTIARYKQALRFVSAYVFLPLIASARNLTTKIVWPTYNAENPSECSMSSDRPHPSSENTLTLPMVNPTAWLLPVDTAHPFANLLPQLPPDDPYAIRIQPLTELCNTGNIREYLGSDWNPSQYTNRGSLFTSVLHMLLKMESVKSNPQLYDVIKDYLIVIERSTQCIPISRSYVNNLINLYREHPDIYYEEPQPISMPPKETSIAGLTAFVARPLDQKLPSLMYPGISIHVKVSNSGMTWLEPPNSPISPDVVTLPSFDCLLNMPRPEDNPESRCQRDLIPISQPLSHIFGVNYIQDILGKNWKARYPTRISLLIALLTAAEKNPRCQADTELIAVITRYKAACEFVASYVLLPIVVDSQNLNTTTVWSTFDSAYLWRSTIGSHQADGFGPNAVILPLTNPKIWLTPVDHDNPFAYLLPYFPENDPNSIILQPLLSMFESGKIKELLGSSWKSSDYPDRGSLFVSVLRTLLTLEAVRSNQQLYTLVNDYLMALELPALYVHVPHSYVKTIFGQYNIPWMEERYMESIKIPDHIPLPPLINPKKILQVIVPESGAPVVESLRSKKLRLRRATILPSVNCLQGASTPGDDEAAGDSCDSVLEFRLTEPLIEVFGDNYVEEILGADWGSLYPTRISFLAGLLRNAVQNEITLKNSHGLYSIVNSYKEALEVAAPYIFLPMLANYQKLSTKVVWLTYYYDKPWQSHMGRNPPQYPDNSSVTLPLVNPKVWYLPVNRHHPFSGFLPDFPTTNSYEETIAPLRSVLNLQYLRNLTGSEWEPSQYPNRGVFFVSALHTLLKLGPTTMNSNLYTLVRSYYMAIEILSLYLHIPRSYINNAVMTANGTWNVDLDGLMVALMEARTVEERRYQMVLKIFLKQEGLLKRFAIVLPSSTTTKHVFLMTIIKAALSSTTVQLTADTILALKACQMQILTTGAGAEVVGWIWETRVTVKTIIDVKNMVEVVIPIERIPKETRGAYHDLVEYLKHHHDILITEDFPAYRYHTNGAFLRGYLNHLVYKSRVSEETKQNIELVIPYIRYTGPGAQPVSLAIKGRSY